MFKNMSPKMRVVTIVAIIVFIALILFFIMRHRKNKKQATSEKAESSYEPTPAEGGDFRVVPQEDSPENIPEPEIKPTPKKDSPQPRPTKTNNDGQQNPKQVTQRPHLNTTGATRGGALPPMEEDLANLPN